MSGCVTTKWVHPTKSQEDFKRDCYDCKGEAYQRTINMGWTKNNVLIVADEQVKCLKYKHGWSN